MLEQRSWTAWRCWLLPSHDQPVATQTCGLPRMPQQVTPDMCFGSLPLALLQPLLLKRCSSLLMILLMQFPLWGTIWLFPGAELGNCVLRKHYISCSKTPQLWGFPSNYSGCKVPFPSHHTPKGSIKHILLCPSCNCYRRATPPASFQPVTSGMQAKEKEYTNLVFKTWTCQNIPHS